VHCTGVQFEYPDGKNDGSIKGTRYFTCPQDHGSFLRPNRVKLDDPQPSLPEEQNAAGTKSQPKDKTKDRTKVAEKQERMRTVGLSDVGDKATVPACPSSRTTMQQPPYSRGSLMPAKSFDSDPVTTMRQPVTPISPRAQRSQLRDAVEVAQPSRRNTRKSSKGYTPAPAPAPAKATLFDANLVLASRAAGEQAAMTFFADAHVAPTRAGADTVDRSTSQTTVAVTKVAVTAAAKPTAALARDSAHNNPASFPSGVLGASPTHLAAKQQQAPPSNDLAMLHAQRSRLREAVETQSPQRRSRRLPQKRPKAEGELLLS